MKSLHEKYEKVIEYYDPDDDLKTEAMEHHDDHHGAGGCSYYIFKWINTSPYYNREYKI